MGEAVDRGVERVDPVVRLPYFPEHKIRFYFRHWQQLIEYHQLHLRRPYRYPIPLTDRTSPLVVKLMQARSSVISSLACLARRTASPSPCGGPQATGDGQAIGSSV